MSLRYHDQVVAGPGGISREKLEAALAGKQNKLHGSAGQVVGFDAAGAAVAVPGWSNPNLLDNGYFADPINQRGELEYSATAQYAIDRWIIYDSTLSIQDGYLTLSINPGATQGSMVQRIDGDFCYDAKLTFSALFANNIFITGSGSLSKDADDWDSTVVARTDYAGLLFQKNNNYFSAMILTKSGHGINPIAAKLELGNQQTLARQDADGNWVLNGPPPNKAMELQKCQRYAINLVREEAADDFLCVGDGLASETDLVPVFIPLPVPLRAAPSITFTGDWRLVKDRYWEQGVPVASISHAYLCGNGVTVWARCAANSISIGKTYYLCGNGGSQKSLLLSSDL